MSTLLYMVTIGGIGFLLSKQASLKIWAMTYFLCMVFILKYHHPHAMVQVALFIPWIPLLFCLNQKLRIAFITRPLFSVIRGMLPTMSETEREALMAGTVGWEGELLTGRPNFEKLQQMPCVSLSEEEQAFMNGPVQKLCSLINNWGVTHHRLDLPPEVWSFIKQKGFLGMIIPKQYGGLEFSATAQYSILSMIYSHSVTAATTISVPNSLGPAELLLKYGTQEQKDYYLPRLACGEEIPCFALTGPSAGSDAASIPDTGIVCEKIIDKKKVLGILLNWNKRYITLCPVATVLGLAFRLFDPNHLLGFKEDIGISCALIPANTPGVTTGLRHFPLNTAFMNGPTTGKNVFIPIDYLIGGAAMAGQGWRMLMECLSVGRSISLPSSALGTSQAASLASGAYARLRRQFNQPIAHFEGIEEPLARIAGQTYMIEAGIRMTTALIDHGAKPSVAGAILKSQTTERARRIGMDAMDIHGGKGICLGPNNYLGRFYQESPISITVEGANILTRSLIIFGQGAVRCHSYLFKEMESIRDKNLESFDEALWGHSKFILANFVKSMVYGFTEGHFVNVPLGRMWRYYQLLACYSTRLALITDISLGVLGGKLKRKEALSARLGDVLSTLYMLSAVLKRFHDDGEPEADLPLVQWSCQQLLHECEQAFQGIIANFPSKPMRIFLKLILQPFGSRCPKPSDKLGHKVARLLTLPSETRDRLTHLVYKSPIRNSPIGRLEAAFHQWCGVEHLANKVSKEFKEGRLKSLHVLKQIDEAYSKGILTQEEMTELKSAQLARGKSLAVDSFTHQELHFSVQQRKQQELNRNKQRLNPVHAVVEKIN